MYFVSLSTITKIKLNISLIVGFFNLGNFVIKSIITDFYNLVGTVVNLIYLYDEYLAILFY